MRERQPSCRNSSRRSGTGGGRATGVAYFDRDRRERFQRARAVVVSANGAETPRLLLMSASQQFPNGLANSNGLVGKYLMFNSNTRALALFEHELNEYKSVQVTRILHDFYDSDPKRGYYGGGGLDARIGPQPATWAIRTATEGPSWGREFKARLKEFPRSMQVACHGTSLPLEANNVTLDPDVKDAWGLPAIRVTYKDHPDDLATARFLQDRGAELLEAAGALRVTKAPVTAQTSSVHLLGTCRMGDAAAASGRQVPSYSRRPESFPVRRQQSRHVGPRPADDDDSGAGVPRRRAHRPVRQTWRDLILRYLAARLNQISKLNSPVRPSYENVK